MKDLLNCLGTFRHLLTRQEMQTIRGQILAGEHVAAVKGLRRCIALHEMDATNHAAKTAPPMQGVRMRKPV